jgi:C4-dicarboxylate-specific signal transduction histidine kinase
MNILIVEDNADDQRLLRQTLEHHGCTVIEARDGEEGLDLAGRHHPDIIVSDALMPRMDGFQLLRALKSDPHLKSIPFLFYSATYTGEQEEKLAFSLGAEAFVVKPTEPEQFWEKTCAIMKASEARQGISAHMNLVESEEEYLREYSRIVATKLEKKVQELAEALALRKQAEDQLRSLNAELEQRIEREVENNRAKDRILMHQARLAAMGEMLSNIAHQWRQPLNNISLIVQNLQIEFEKGVLTAASCREYVEECIKFLMYMSSTIDNFSALYQPDYDRQLFDLYHTVSETISLVREELESHGITIKLVKECDSTVNGFKKEFSLVLLNIIQNAKEAIMSRQPAVPFVEIVCSKKGESALVRVKDNGGGIPSEIMDKIFDPYFTIKFKAQGVGMGLYMSKMIIEKHMGGRIYARNSSSGAELTIELPLECESSRDAL